VSFYGDRSTGATNTNRVFGINIHLESKHDENVFIIETWCYGGNRIVPVTVQVWDYLSSSIEMTLGPNKVPMMDP
jgi:hypothetical protein